MAATLNNVNPIAPSSIFTAIALIPWLGQRVYEKLYNDILEASFILNICLFSIATFYVQAAGGNQATVTTLFISIALFQFMGIIGFHIYLRFKNTKLGRLPCMVGKCVSTVAKRPPLSSKESEEKQPSAQEVSTTLVELREPLLDNAVSQ